MQNRILEEPGEELLLNEELTEETRPVRNAQQPTRPRTAGEAGANSAEREWRLGEYYVAKGTSALPGGGQAAIYPCRRDGTVEEYIAKIYHTETVKRQGLDPRKLKTEINDKISAMPCESVARILEHGFTDGEQYYIVVMKKYRKVPEDFLNFELHGREKGYEERFFDAVEDMFEALGMIHAQNILHCDIKPDNIMMDGDRLVLIDFGASAMRARKRGKRESIPMKYVTFGYTAPEMEGSKVANVRKSTDIYAMGLTLAEMVAGVFPRKLKKSNPRMREYLERNRSEGAMLYGEILLPKGLPDYMVRLFEGLLYEGSVDEPDLYRWGNDNVEKWLELARQGDKKAAAGLPVGHGQTSARVQAGQGAGALEGRRGAFGAEGMQTARHVPEKTLSEEHRAAIRIPYADRTETFSTEEGMLEVFRKNWKETVSMMADKDASSDLPGFFKEERGWNNVYANLQNVRKNMWDREAEGEELFFDRIMMTYLPERVKVSQLWYRNLRFETKEQFGSSLYSVLRTWNSTSGGTYSRKKARGGAADILQMFAAGRVSDFLAQPGVTWQVSGEDRERVRRIEDFLKRNPELPESVKKADFLEDLYALAFRLQKTPCFQFGGQIFDSYPAFLAYVGDGRDCGAVRERMSMVSRMLMTPEKKWKVDFYAWLQIAGDVKQAPGAGMREDI